MTVTLDKFELTFNFLPAIRRSGILSATTPPEKRKGIWDYFVIESHCETAACWSCSSVSGLWKKMRRLKSIAFIGKTPVANCASDGTMQHTIRK